MKRMVGLRIGHEDYYFYEDPTLGAHHPICCQFLDCRAQASGGRPRPALRHDRPHRLENHLPRLAVERILATSLGLHFLERVFFHNQNPVRFQTKWDDGEGRDATRTGWRLSLAGNCSSSRSREGFPSHGNYAVASGLPRSPIRGRRPPAFTRAP